MFPLKIIKSQISIDGSTHYGKNDCFHRHYAYFGFGGDFCRVGNERSGDIWHYLFYDRRVFLYDPCH